MNYINEYSYLEIKNIEEKMRPGHCSSEGFLSLEDDLETIYENDLQFLNHIGISPQQIADHLKGFIEKAKEIQDFSLEKLIGTKYKISGSSTSTNGYQECPFPSKHGGNCFEGRNDYKVTNRFTNESITFTDLGIHLIEKHGFFQGHTPYRIDPSKVIQVLDLKAGEYQKILIKEWKWISGDIDDIHLKDEKRLAKHAKQIILIDEYATAYLGVPFHDYESYKYNGMTRREKLIKQYKKQNLRDQEIEEKIHVEENRLKKWGSSENLDHKIIHPQGNEYLHFINKKDRRENSKWKPIIGGSPIKENVSYLGSYIFESEVSSYADIHCD